MYIYSILMCVFPSLTLIENAIEPVLKTLLGRWTVRLQFPFGAIGTHGSTCHADIVKCNKVPGNDKWRLGMHWYPFEFL